MKFCFGIKAGLAAVLVLPFSLSHSAPAQDTSQPTADQQPAPGSGSGGWQGQGRGQHGGRGMSGGFGMGMGRGLMGTVTEVAADHYTIKTDAGETYVVYYSANTRMMKQSVQHRRPDGQNGPDGQGGQGGQGGNPPQPIKATGIKVGDAIAAMGEIDATTKSVGAVMVMQLDPERAKQMREMQANYGKTWLMGKITAVDGVKVTLMGALDNTAHDFVADENTTFRKHRDPITLADLQVGDTIRVEGAIKDGSFLATTVSAMGPPQDVSVPRSAPPQ
jgi:hypothetical protein